MPRPRPSAVPAGAISAIEPDSLAEEAGLQPGDQVLAVNGQPIRDPVDYRFQTTDDLVELEVVHDGELGLVEFEKPIDEPLGIEFDDNAFDGTRICNNKCFFCFLKGLPKGLRRPLYIKDDDYRLSFLHGNFVTLTNLSDDDWVRLEEQRLSPLHVSVHATDLNLRRQLLGNHNAPDIIEQLRRLAEMRIEAHTQVVLCPGVNDGDALDQTVSDLLAQENVTSIGVVPVGSSLEGEERIGDPGMRAHSQAEARVVVKQLRHWQRQARSQRGRSVVFPSDEFYLTAGAQIPSARRYDGFPQWENGIGMTRTLVDDWRKTRRRIRQGNLALPRASAIIACGTLIAPTLRDLCDEASSLTGVDFEIVPVGNTLFGARVNVSGLIPGGDFATALSAIDLPEHVFLPRSSLDYFGAKFLDDLTPEALETTLDRPIKFVYTLSELLESIATGADHGDAGSRQPTPNQRSNGRSWTTPVAG
jgi:putative radical SAM enzyme (TIGR03279 family)